jgi:hypothetical protein
MEGTCVHRHRQCALHVLHLWLAGSQVCGLSVEGRTRADPCEAGTSPGSASQASPRPSHSLTAKDAQDAPYVVYGMFLVQGVLASVIFDSGATCSYITSKFAREHSIPVTPQSVPIDTISPLGTTRSTKIYKGVRITIEGCTFLADLTILPSEVLDVILGMDWLTLHKGVKILLTQICGDHTPEWPSNQM